MRRNEGTVGHDFPALVLALLVAPAVASAEEKTPYDPAAAALGAVTYRANCARCHGETGQGDGPLAAQLATLPLDLTRLAGRNGDKYPFDKVYRIIDGRSPVKGHGGGDMPVWGDVFLEAREGYDREKVREKITQLVHFVASLQRDGRK